MSPKQHCTKNISGGKIPDSEEKLCETNQKAFFWKQFKFNDYMKFNP